MCLCPSCKTTDALHDKGFAAWPRGNPAGAKAKADYAVHVRACLAWGPNRAPELPAGIWIRSPFPCTGTGWSDPHGHYKFPGTWRNNRRIPDAPNARAYIKAFEKLNALRGTA